MFTEISKLLFLTDNNCYCLIHNWIPRDGLLLISKESFFSVNDNDEANQNEILPSLEKTDVDEAQRTKNVARARNGTAHARDEERAARYDKACKKLNMTLRLS